MDMDIIFKNIISKIVLFKKKNDKKCFFKDIIYISVDT